MFVPNNTTGYNQTYDETNILEDEMYLLHDDGVHNRVWAAERILLILIAVFTVLGNTVLLFATWREKTLHQPNQYFIASRTVADLFVGIFVAPYWLKQFYEPEHASESGIWPSTDLCNCIVWMDTFVLTASIYTLIFISYERYLKIGKPWPPQYRSRMTTCTSLKVIFIIWIISAVFATYAATPHSGSVGIWFSADVCDHDITKQFYTFVAVSAFFLPTTLIVIMCARIFLVAHKRHKLLRNGELGQTSNHPGQQITFHRELKAIRMLSVVVGVFIFCWCPFHIWNLLVFYDPDVFEGDENSLSYLYLLEISGVVVFALPLLNSLCNPIIYVCLDHKYRDALKLLLQQIMCRPSLRRRRPPNATELRPLRTTTLTDISDLTVN